MNGNDRSDVEYYALQVAMTLDKASLQEGNPISRVTIQADTITVWWESGKRLDFQAINLRG